MVATAYIKQPRRRSRQDRILVVAELLSVRVQFLGSHNTLVQLIGDRLLVQIGTDKDNLLPPIRKFLRDKVFTDDLFAGSG